MDRCAPTRSVPNRELQRSTDAATPDTLASVDRLLYAVPELASGMDHVEELLGVRPVVGGRHPGFSTHNALLSLEPATYLEVIARDPDLAPPEWGILLDLDDTVVPHLAGWVWRCDPYAMPFDGALPFLIAWGETAHPAATVPVAGRLQDLRVEHPRNRAAPCRADRDRSRGRATPLRPGGHVHSTRCRTPRAN